MHCFLNSLFLLFPNFSNIINYCKTNQKMYNFFTNFHFSLIIEIKYNNKIVVHLIELVFVSNVLSFFYLSNIFHRKHENYKKEFFDWKQNYLNILKYVFTHHRFENIFISNGLLNSIPVMRIHFRLIFDVIIINKIVI